MRIETYLPVPLKHMEYQVRYHGPVIVEVDWVDELNDLQGVKYIYK
jgi:hypothetical protein